MKITAIRGRPAGPDNAEFLLELIADDGLVGQGPCLAECESAAGILAESILLGEDPRAVSAHWQRLSAAVAAGDDRGNGMRAAAALDIALWDLKARSEGQPLWRSLGGCRPRLPACAVLGASDSADGASAADLGELAAAHGFRAAMLEVLPKQGLSAAQVEAARTALAAAPHRAEILLRLGPEVGRDEALEALRPIEAGQDIACVQAPLSGWGGDGLKALSGEIFAAVSASGLAGPAEGLFAQDGHPGFDMLTIDVAVSGITGSLQISDAAYGYELPVMLAPSTANIAIHLAAALPNLAYLQIDPRTLDSAVSPSIARVEDGRAVTGNEIGIGLAAKPEGRGSR